MTEKDFKKVGKNECCPFLSKLVIKEHKKLVKVASVGNKEKVYELREKGNNTSFGVIDNVKIENLVLADEKSYEGIFVKFFKTKFLASLNNYALKIFIYITEHLEVNNNKIGLKIEKLSINCQIQEPRKIYEGLNELIEKNIIAKHSIEDLYYVNPSIIFRGSNRKILLTHKDY